MHDGKIRVPHSPAVGHTTSHIDMVKRKRRIRKDVAFQDGLVAAEPNLPLPVVYYPGHYGSFFGFGETNNSDIFFCSCCTTAIINYIRFRLESYNTENSDPHRNFILSKSKFPQHIVQKLIELHTPSNQDVINGICFRDELCHECNKQTPSYSYCHPMYGGVFEQNYGWYINKQSFEYGVMPISFRILEDVCPDEVFSLLDISKEEFFQTYNHLSETDLLIGQARDSRFQKHCRKIRKIIENEVRVKFGFKKVGETWATETLLYQLVCEMLPEEKVYRHYRPGFLENLELDVFIPKLNVGIEYQGIQHFKPVKHWGGQDALKQAKQRDKRKRDLCKKNGVKLVHFYYYEDISRELIERRVKL
jgi:hypothetical protein